MIIAGFMTDGPGQGLSLYIVFVLLYHICFVFASACVFVFVSGFMSDRPASSTVQLVEIKVLFGKNMWLKPYVCLVNLVKGS